MVLAVIALTALALSQGVAAIWDYATTADVYWAHYLPFGPTPTTAGPLFMICARITQVAEPTGRAFTAIYLVLL